MKNKLNWKKVSLALWNHTLELSTSRCIGFETLWILLCCLSFSIWSWSVSYSVPFSGMPGLIEDQCLLGTGKGRMHLHLFNSTIAARPMTRITWKGLQVQKGTWKLYSSLFLSSKPLQSKLWFYAEKLLKFQVAMRKKPHGCTHCKSVSA